MRNRAFTLIELLVVILIIGILLALVIPNFVLFQERARRASVKNNMHIVQTVLEAYATDHYGSYPGEDYVGDWDPTDDTPANPVTYFPGGDPFDPEDPTVGKPGNLPINPYDGKAYNADDAEDVGLIYGEEVVELGACAVVNSEGSDVADCPYLDLEGTIPGSIQVVVGEHPDTGVFVEYGVCGYGKTIYQPIFEVDPVEPDIFIFFVLHN